MNYDPALSLKNHYIRLLLFWLGARSSKIKCSSFVLLFLKNYASASGETLSTSSSGINTLVSPEKNKIGCSKCQIFGYDQGLLTISTLDYASRTG
jgi:hypothetical protein